MTRRWRGDLLIETISRLQFVPDESFTGIRRAWRLAQIAVSLISLIRPAPVIPEFARTHPSAMTSIAPVYAPLSKNLYCNLSTPFRPYKKDPKSAEKCKIQDKTNRCVMDGKFNSFFFQTGLTRPIFYRSNQFISFFKIYGLYIKSLREIDTISSLVNKTFMSDPLCT